MDSLKRPREIAVGVLQLRAHDREAFPTVWPSVLQRIERAAACGARLVVLPEGTVPAYVIGYEPYDPSPTERAIEELREIARRTRSVIVVGAARQDGGRLYNGALTIDGDGSVAGWADKQFLWHFDRQWFSAGERLEPIRTQIGTIGALVCADGRIPTIARTLVDRGAEILVMPTAWVSSGRNPNDLENAQADLLVRVRAKENRVPFVAANKAGVERGCVLYCGKSQIVAADGTLTALASQDGDDTLAAKVELARPAAQRAHLPAPSSRTACARSIRIAISAIAPTAATPERLRILEVQASIAPGAPDAARAALDALVPTAFVDDAAIFDPAGLEVYRRAGYQLAVWETRAAAAWRDEVMRARALELRMYVVAIDIERRRACAADPDGAIVCGTFDGYELASFTLDPSRTAQTHVAPGTDVLAGLERAHELGGCRS